MTRAFLTVGTIMAGVLLAACNNKACERYCNQCEDNDMMEFYEYQYTTNSTGDYYDDTRNRVVVSSVADCVETCREALRGETVGCRSAFRRAARCFDQLGCSENDYDYDNDCSSPLYDVEDECDFY